MPHVPSSLFQHAEADKCSNKMGLLCMNMGCWSAPQQHDGMISLRLYMSQQEHNESS